MEAERGSRLVRLTLWSYGAAALLFLYAPLALLIGFSFNDSEVLGFPFRGLTLRWYRDLGEDGQVWKAAWSSLSLASITAIVSTVVATMAAFPLVRSQFRLKKLVRLLLVLPALVPEFLLGVSLLVFFYFARLRLSLSTAAAGHILFTLPFAILVIVSRLQGMDRSPELAAADLGANPAQVFRHVTLPLMFPGILAAALLAFTLSLDQFLVTLFTIGPDTTLPIYVWSSLKFELTPKLNALGAIIFTVSFTLVLFVYRLGGLRAAGRSGG